MAKMRQEALRVLQKKSSTKEALRRALAAVLGVAYLPLGVKTPNEDAAVRREMGKLWDRAYVDHKGSVYVWQKEDYAALANIYKALKAIDAEGSKICAVFGQVCAHPVPWYLENDLKLASVSRNLNSFLAHAKKANNTRDGGFSAADFG